MLKQKLLFIKIHEWYRTEQCVRATAEVGKNKRFFNMKITMTRTIQEPLTTEPLGKQLDYWFM